MHRRRFLHGTLGLLLLSHHPWVLADPPAPTWDAVAAGVAAQLLDFLRHGLSGDLITFLIRDMLGEPGIQRLPQLSAQALQSIRSIMDDSLRRDDYNRTVEDFAGIGEIFKQYHSTPEDLKDVVDRISIVTAHLQALPAYALPMYTLATNLKLSAQALMADHPDAVRHTASASHAWLNGRLGTVPSEVRQAFGDIAVQHRGKWRHNAWEAWYTVNEVVAWRGQYRTRQEALDAANARLNREVHNRVQPFLGRFQAVARAWDQVAHLSDRVDTVLQQAD